MAGLLLERPGLILVLEAVLSTYHDPATDNPGLRGEFERGRGWYWGPGAVSCLAAQRFLTMLTPRLGGQRIVLAEAFVSNKTGPTGHGEDARLIAHHFWNSAGDYQPRQDSQPVLQIIQGVPQVRVFVCT